LLAYRLKTYATVLTAHEFRNASTAETFSALRPLGTHVLIMSAFYRLPVELLTIIAQYVTLDKERFERGKVLRLTHPYFANLDYLNAYLFRNINFRATPEGVDRLKAHPLAALKSFVRKITFLPSEYSTGMTFFHFRRIVILQCSFNCPADCSLVIHTEQHRGMLIEAMESAWASRPLFSPEDLLASFQDYRRQALAAQSLLTDGSLHVWEETIRQFPNAKTFEYGKLKEHERTYERPIFLPRAWYESETDSVEGLEKRRVSLDLPTLPHLVEEVLHHHVRNTAECRVHRDHPHDDYYHWDDGVTYHPPSECQLHAIRVQAALIEPISACINAAGAQPETLIFSSALTTFETGHPLPPNLQALDLSRLRSLEWRTDLFNDGSHVPSSAHELNAFIMALLQKCHLSIQDLRIVPDIGEERLDRERTSLWPPLEATHLPLPNLRRLHLTDLVAPHRLAPWIASMPHLETLSLLHGAAYEVDGCWNWRLVLDAIRNHPSLLQVRLEVACQMSDERFFVAALSTSTRKSDQTKRAFQVGFGDGWDMKFELEGEGNSLCRWIEGEECEWDWRLDRFFPLRDESV